MSNSTLHDAGDWRIQHGKVVARAWGDPAFNARPLADRAGALPVGELEKFERREQVTFSRRATYRSGAQRR